jgi:hypothetical protein
MAKVLTYPERVNELNKEFLQKLIINGSHEHPGANAIYPSDERNKGEWMTKLETCGKFVRR